MTAEIAIMNRSAVALAADSAVTLETQTTTKTYHTVNKLFTLSKYHPVGVMIYQNADFMDIPWETLIKMFRAQLKDNKKGTVQEYAKAFINFVHTTVPTTKERQAHRAFGMWYSYFERLNKREIRRALIRSSIEVKRPLNSNEARDIIKKTLKNELDRLRHLNVLEAFDGVAPGDLVSKYENEFEQAVEGPFQGKPLTKQGLQYIREIAGLLVVKTEFSPIMSGVVFAGFGDDEYFPSLLHCRVDGIIDDKPVMMEDEYQDISREPKDRGRVLAFAQREMVERFMAGVDAEYLGAIEKSVGALIERFSDRIIDKYVTGSAAEKSARRGQARRAGRLMLHELMDRFVELRQVGFVNPVMQAVQVLPKEEMAELAESLVNLTSIKRRMSFDADTVGGPIDVAVISKGDGFIWIKRKHYFEKELNPHFISQYLRD